MAEETLEEPRNLVLPEWLTDIRDVLTAFGRSPSGFVLGVVLSTVLGGLEVVVTTVLNALNTLFVGSGPGLSGTLGIADVPLLVGSLLTDVGRAIGFGTATQPGLIDVAESATTALINLASSFGPLAPVALAVIVAGLGIATAWLARTVLEIVVDVVPGGGALIN